MVLRGSNGWLFLKEDANDVIGQHTGAVGLSAFHRWRWRRLLRRRRDMQRTLGVVWAHEIVPDKEAVYAEYLPASISAASERPVHEVLGLAKTLAAPVHYLLGDLEAAKGWGELYSKTDTHWNHRGAFVAYAAICRRLAERGINLRVVEESEISWSQREALQDLGSKVRPPILSELITADLRTHRSRIIFDNRIKVRGRVMLFEQDAPELPSAVLFGDSFAMHLIPFFKETFRRFAFVHTLSVVPEIVAAEQPDIVLTVSIERFMIQPPSDRDALLGLNRVVSTKARWGEIHDPDDPLTASFPRDHDRYDPSTVASIPWQDKLASPSTEPSR